IHDVGYGKGLLFIMNFLQRSSIVFWLDLWDDCLYLV
ncbi:MAG: hypothetical protein QG670_2824, partial [Thermoproteota archaeon]|nr:hypothetical protein [Thermoproteota archaeon]